jgi:hypothetical protein
MPWVTLVAGDNTLGTYNMPSPPRVGESIRIGMLLTDPMYRVTAVVWEVVPEMSSPEFDHSQAPAMLAYVRPLNGERPAETPRDLQRFPDDEEPWEEQ